MQFPLPKRKDKQVKKEAILGAAYARFPENPELSASALFRWLFDNLIRIFL